MDVSTITDSGYRDRNSTADRALTILEMFSDTQPSVTAVEVAAELSVARSTAYRYLESLTSRGFLEESPGSCQRLQHVPWRGGPRHDGHRLPDL